MYLSMFLKKEALDEDTMVMQILVRNWKGLLDVSLIIYCINKRLKAFIKISQHKMFVMSNVSNWTVINNWTISTLYCFKYISFFNFLRAFLTKNTWWCLPMQIFWLDEPSKGEGQQVRKSWKAGSLYAKNINCWQTDRHDDSYLWCGALIINIYMNKHIKCA
jgi:hypothetical protein